uniref:Centrosomal AT-AC splicing factor n=1 Tax=Scleropages formosus TaxID=113540 RepID=A0A8C9VTI3_SCLFO
MDAFYCAVCRQTSFAGKGHRYGKSHQAKLKVVLVKFLEKRAPCIGSQVKEARRTVKNPRVEKFRSAEHETSFWCYCCAREVPKHVSNGDVAVLFGGLLEHMATPEHKKNTNKFWWENKAEPKLKEKFLITSEEAERFKTEVARALETFEEKEDELIKQQAAIIRAQEQHRKEVLQSLLEVGLPRMPLNCIHIAVISFVLFFIHVDFFLKSILICACLTCDLGIFFFCALLMVQVLLKAWKLLWSLLTFPESKLASDRAGAICTGPT